MKINKYQKIINEYWDIFKSFEEEWYKNENIMKTFFQKMIEEIKSITK